MVFIKGHTINKGRVWSQERNNKISKALNKQKLNVCIKCKGEFLVPPNRYNAKYCSHKCRQKRINKICLQCSKNYIVQLKRIDSKYCSGSCRGKASYIKNKDKFLYDRHGKNHPMFGKHHSEETKRKIGQAHVGKRMGELNNKWKGGINPINDTIRKSQEYILWRTAVFTRDNYTCIKCGEKGYVNADHIKPFASYPELRFIIDNGQTLCKSCHSKKTSQDMILMRKEKPQWEMN